MALLFASSALATATTIPLSLNEPVGLHPSSLRYSSPQPVFFSSSPHLTRGVSPSPNENKGVLGVIGRKSLYLTRTPVFICLATLPLCPSVLIVLLLHQPSRIKALPDFQSFLTAYQITTRI